MSKDNVKEKQMLDNVADRILNGVPDTVRENRRTIGKSPFARAEPKVMVTDGVFTPDDEVDLPVVVQASRQHTDERLKTQSMINYGMIEAEDSDLPVIVHPMVAETKPEDGLTYAQAVELAKGSSFPVLRSPVELPPKLVGETSSQNFSAAGARQKIGRDIAASILEGRSLPPETFWAEHMNYWKPPEVYDHKRVIADMIEIVDFATSGRIEQMKAATETLAAYLDRFPEMAAEARHVHNLATGAGNRLRLMRMETVEQEAKVAEAQARAFASGQPETVEHFHTVIAGVATEVVRTGSFRGILHDRIAEKIKEVEKTGLCTWELKDAPPESDEPKMIIVKEDTKLHGLKPKLRPVVAVAFDHDGSVRPVHEVKYGETNTPITSVECRACNGHGTVDVVNSDGKEEAKPCLAGCIEGRKLLPTK